MLLNQSKGKLIFVAISCLLGVATILSSYFFFVLIPIYTAYLFRYQGIKIATLSVCMCIFSFCCSFFIHNSNQTILNEKMTTFFGYIKDDLKINGDSLSFVLESEEQEQIIVFYRLKTELEKEKAKELQYGRYIRLKGELSRPNGQRIPNGFDYEAYLKRNGIHWMMSAKELVLFEQVHTNPLLMLKNFRQKMINHVEETYRPLPASFIQALVFGHVNEIDNQIQDQYETYGLSHLLAISGSHFTLLIGAVSLGLWRLGVTREKTIYILCILIPLYAVLAGAAPSVIRAAFSGTIVVFSLLFQRKDTALDVLSVVFIVLLMIHPSYLVDVGFQLSFAVSASLIISSERLLKGEYSYLQLTFYVTIISQLSSLPIVLYHFYEISPYSLLLNLFFIPFLSFSILPLCIIATLFYWTSISSLLNLILEYILQLAHQLLSFCELLPFGTIVFGTFSILLGTCLVASVYYLFLCWERGDVKRGGWPIVVVLVLLYISPFLRIEGVVTFLDVGQGDCIVIELPFRKGVYVIDTGGSLPFQKEEWQEKREAYHVAEKVIAPYLKSRGIHTIDKLILSHGDYDHMGEAVTLMDELQIKEIIVGKKEKRPDLEKEVITKALQKGIDVVEVKSGMSWTEGNFQFSVLGPYEAIGEENNQSIVLHTKLGGASFLFTGDLEEDGEKWLVDAYPNLDVDVLKIGHHGSKSSTTQQLLEQYNPQIGIISVGQNNRYNHPNVDVLKRLEEQNVFIFRTDEDGSVQYIFRKKGTFQKMLHTL
ncbi:MAG: DNA internalization-related competence protein ComEC/Rec2 [Bacillaceae bacterium]